MPEQTGPITPASPVRLLWPPGRHGYAGRMGTIAMNCLRRSGIGTVGELTAMTPLDIADLNRAGTAVVGEVRRALDANGLSLKDDDAPARAEVQARARVLTRAGLARSPALRFARECWPSGEIAPGVVLTVTGEGRG
ncbi:MAG TPA: DNA-directed RNA polymerase subunit alpha C-terminal domain-containing protein [Streptosporangiaceae bacterium]|nr:DNA-directed RNA polymerase subunit alpha C-terminal domain-containing protein [Streptosporangiaceae bacterium]